MRQLCRVRFVAQMSPSAGNSSRVTARFHPFVPHSDDRDHAFLGDATVENVKGLLTRAASVEPRAYRTWKLRIPGRSSARALISNPSGLSRNLAHRSDEEGGVSLPAFCAPPLGACRKDVGKIDLRWAGEAEPRHAT